MMNYLMTPAADFMPDMVAGEAANPRQKQLEAAARAQGFPSYEAYRLWTAQRERQHTGSVSGAGSSLPQSVDAAKQAAMAWHPATILSAITEKLKQATGN